MTAGRYQAYHASVTLEFTRAPVARGSTSAIFKLYG